MRPTHPGPARCGRGGAGRSDDRLVHEAPTPVLAGLERADDRVADLGPVLARVPLRRGVAAADVTAGQAFAQVHPDGAHGEAVLAALGRAGRRLGWQLGDVRALGHGSPPRLGLTANLRRSRVAPPGDGAGTLLRRPVLLPAPAAHEE